MEITIVALEPYVSEFSQGGGFLPSTKFAPSSVGEDAAPSEVGRGGRGGFVAAFPSGCTSDAQVGPDSHKRKRTVTKAMFNDDDIGATARAEGTSLPSRLCFILGRDPASSNVVVKHNLTQGPLLSRRHCAIRAWFPRSSCHPSVRGAGMKANIAIAFDCIDLGSINGTFVDNRKMPSGSNNRSAALRPCAVIDADRLLKPEDSSFGLRLFSLSFGIGSKIAEGGALPVEQERLRFDVFVTLAPRFYHSDHIDADTLVRCLFHDTLPAFHIAAPRSSLAALSKVTLDNEEEERKDGDIDDAFRQSVQRGEELHALPPPQSNAAPGAPFGGSPTRPTSKPLLLAAKSSGMLSPQKSRITIVGDDNTMNQKGHSSYALRQRTDDVLSSILKDHGYSMLSAAQKSHKSLSTAVTGAELEPQQLVVAVATADTSGASHQQTVAQGSLHVLQSDGVAGSNVAVGMSSEVAGSFLPNVSPKPAADELAPVPTIFEVAADRMQLPSVQNSDVVGVQPHLAQPPHSQPVEEPALLLRRGAAATRRVSGRGPAAPNAAVVLVPDSLPMISQMPVPAFQPQEHAASNEQRSREAQRKKTEETNRPFSMIALSVEEGLVHLSPPPVFLSQPLSQGAHNGETGCELGAEAPTHQQLLPKKAPEAVMKAEPDPVTAGKKSKKGKRNTDPQETIARFCEALRADGGGGVSPAVATVATASNQGHAMAQTIKAGLQFMAQMNRVEVPAHEELRNDDDDDEDDVPLGKIVAAPPSATPLPRPPSNIATTTTKITDAATIVPSNIIGVCHDSYVAAPHSAPPPYVNELDSCWSQADEVIQSQLAGGGDMSLDDHQPTAGGCVLIAGGRSIAPTTTTSAHRNMSLRATQRVETLKCLFTDDTDSSDGAVAAAAAAAVHPQPQRKQTDDDSAAFAKRHPSKFGQLRPEVPPAAMIAAAPAAPILGSTPAMHPPLVTGAVAPADDKHVPHRSSVSLWSDGSCASWEGSQEELTLLATQLTAPSSSHHHHNHHSSTQLTMQSQMALTRHPVRRIAVEALLLQGRSSPAVPFSVLGKIVNGSHHTHNEEREEDVNHGVPSQASQMDALAAGDDDGYDEAPSVQSQEIQQRSQQQHVAPLAATTTRRVTFHPSVSAIDLSTEGPSQRSSTPRIPNPAKHPSSIPVKPSRMSAAAQRRAKLEAVLMALPTTKDDDEEKPLTTKAEDLQDEVAKAFHAPQHTTGWDRTLSTLAMDEDAAAAAHRVINAPCPGVGSAIAPQELRSVLKPHQWEALRFMWQCLMEEDDDSNNNNNNGDGNNGVRGGPVRRPRNDSLSGAVKSSLKKRARTEESSPSSHLKITVEEHRDDSKQRPSTKYDFDDIDGDGTSHLVAKEEIRHHRPRGCVLAHAMGLGKSLTTISFLFSLWRYLGENPRPPLSTMPWAHHLHAHHGARVVICVPKPLVYHWIREFHTWSTAMGEDAVTIYLLSQDTKSDKFALLQEWAAEGTESGDVVSEQQQHQEGPVPRVSRSILLVTHSTLCAIMMSTDDANNTSNTSSATTATRKRRAPAKKKKPHHPADDDETFWYDEGGQLPEDDDIGAVAGDASDARRTQRLEHLQACRNVLLHTANCIIVDEAHKLQAPTSRLAQSVSAFRSGQVMKIALTGTPVTSSKRDELLAMVQFVMPSLWTKRDLSDRSLLAEMKRFVHGRGMEVLAAELPSIVEHTVVVRMSPEQEDCFRALIHAEAVHGVIPPKRMLETVSRTMLISNHLDLVSDWCRRRGIDAAPPTVEGSLLVAKDVRWALPSLPLPSIFDSSSTTNDEVTDAEHEEGDYNQGSQTQSPPPAAVESLQYSWKMRVLVVLLQHALANNEKVVVFSHSVKTLYLIGKLMSVAFGAADGVDFALLDGRIPSAVRDDITLKFNDHAAEMRVLLLTFQSNSIGQNFTGAQRVVLFESSWRRSMELQAICRVFRYGQQHHVFVNRLVSLNGIEERIMELRDGKSSGGRQGRKPAAFVVGETAECPWPTSVGADELLRCLMPKKKQSHSFSSDLVVDDVLGAVVSGASTIADVRRDFSFE